MLEAHRCQMKPPPENKTWRCDSGYQVAFILVSGGGRIKRYFCVKHVGPSVVHFTYVSGEVKVKRI